MPKKSVWLLNISKRSLQSYREYGIIPYSCIGGKYVYKESDLARILIQKADNIWTE